MISRVRCPWIAVACVVLLAGCYSSGRTSDPDAGAGRDGSADSSARDDSGALPDGGPYAVIVGEFQEVEPLTCLPRCDTVDLWAGGGSIDPDGRCGSDLRFGLSVFNCGARAVSTGFDVAYYAGDPEQPEGGAVLFRNIAIPSNMPPRSVAEVSFTVPRAEWVELPETGEPGGNHEIDLHIIVDPDDRVDECDERQLILPFASGC